MALRAGTRKTAGRHQRDLRCLEELATPPYTSAQWTRAANEPPRPFTRDEQALVRYAQDANAEAAAEAVSLGETRVILINRDPKETFYS